MSLQGQSSLSRVPGETFQTTPGTSPPSSGEIAENSQKSHSQHHSTAITFHGLRRKSGGKPGKDGTHLDDPE